MEAVIRTDASSTIGSGHVMRCLTLADSLRANGVNVSFVVRPAENDRRDLLCTRGYRNLHFGAQADSVSVAAEPAHAIWNDVAWQGDARETLAAIAAHGRRPDWLVVDHYGLDYRWESALRVCAQRVVVVDDLANRSHNCDFLLDQNLVDDYQGRYFGRVPESCALMLGPTYALLQSIYAELHERVVVRQGPVRRLLIYFGAADSPNLTGLALNAFLQLGRSDIEADVVLSGLPENNQAVERLARGQANIKLHSNLPSLASLIARADLAIGAGGSTTWERLSLGLPALVIALAPNQRPVAGELHRRGMVRWLGNWDEVTLPGLRHAIAAEIERGCNTESSRAGHAAVDGKGASRVVAALLLNSSTPLIARKASLADEALLLEWANDATTRRNSFSRAIISPEEHHRWLLSKLHALDSCLMLVIETKAEIPIGMVRFDAGPGEWTVNYAIAEAYRGRGLGRRILELGLAKLANDHGRVSVVAKVTAGNARSHRVFSSLGFSVTATPDGLSEYRQTL